MIKNPLDSEFSYQLEKIATDCVVFDRLLDEIWMIRGILDVLEREANGLSSRELDLNELFLKIEVDEPTVMSGRLPRIQSVLNQCASRKLLPVPDRDVAVLQLTFI